MCSSGINNDNINQGANAINQYHNVNSSMKRFKIRQGKDVFAHTEHETPHLL
jgi:hypothetical protein